MFSTARSRVSCLTVLAAGVLTAASVTPPAGATVTHPRPLRVSYAAAAAPTHARAAHGEVRPLSIRLANRHWAAPPTTADCQTSVGIACYSPLQFQRAYRFGPLYRHGLTGRGSTIAIVDAFGSPTAQADLEQFDSDYGLPNPPHFRVIQPAGPVAPFDPTDSDRVGWALETSLDVQYAHAMAPGANILLVETPVTETEGVQGLPEIVKAENYVVRHHLADVISQSFGATEETFPSARSIRQLRSAFKNAARHHVTVLASSGDSGPTDTESDLTSSYPYRVTSWPSTDPLVTSVGGTQLHLDAAGNRTAPDNVWNDTALLGGLAASGGGRSHVFARPRYQNRVARVVGHRRGVPDISMSAAVDGGALVYLGFLGSDSGYTIVGGTSEASPMFAGVVAVAKQRAHHRLGLINPRLYRIAGHRRSGVVDVTRGNTTVSFTQDGQDITVPGFRAVRGYDLATGWGTVDAPRFTAALAR